MLLSVIVGADGRLMVTVVVGMVCGADGLVVVDLVGEVAAVVVVTVVNGTVSPRLQAAARSSVVVLFKENCHPPLSKLLRHRPSSSGDVLDLNRSVQKHVKQSIVVMIIPKAKQMLPDNRWLKISSLTNWGI